MTDDERHMIANLAKGIDMILAGLSSGAGLHDWEDMASSWDEGTRQLRSRLQAAYEAESSKD